MRLILESVLSALIGQAIRPLATRAMVMMKQLFSERNLNDLLSVLRDVFNTIRQ